jgi:3-oxoacyl-(acyl-carrier-protein) synthase
LTSKIAAEVADFDPSAHFDVKTLSLMDRFAQFAVVAARQAIADAGLEERCGLTTATIIGSGVGGQTTLDEAYKRLYGANATRLHPFTIPRLMLNAAASHVSMDLRLGGPAFAVASACASGTHALGQALRMVRDGDVEIAVSRNRGVLDARHTKGVGGFARDERRHLSAVLAPAQRHGVGRGSSDYRARVIGVREGARRADLRRNSRLRDVG